MEFPPPHISTEDIRRRYDAYIVVHIGKIVGGFGKRFHLFIKVLSSRCFVQVMKPSTALRYLLIQNIKKRKICFIIYYDVLAPFVALVSLLFPNHSTFYMVRGDQVAWSNFHGRKARAWSANFFQRCMKLLGCFFVFASEDLYNSFLQRLGPFDKVAILPNTAGYLMPPSRSFNGRVAIVGEFGTVKNIEFVLEKLSDSGFQIDLYGNTSCPENWQQPWLTCHGVVSDLKEELRQCTLVVLSSVTEGFPNVIVDALEAGCAVVAPYEMPFEKLPLNPMWRYHKKAQQEYEIPNNFDNDLPIVLQRLLKNQPNFRENNRELYNLIESDWEERVWEIFE